MPVIRRDDGIQFAIQTYRELLSSKSASLLKSEIRLLSQQHGEYVRLFRDTKNSIEAVFSRDPGFLLGESIWYYFGRPSDLIYCEALPDSQQALVVVVKSSTIYLDTKIPYASLIDEFSTLLTGANQYDVHVYGNVPISKEPAPETFVFQPEQVASFHVLERSLLNQLAPDESLELQPLELALRSEIFAGAIPTKYIAYGVALVVLLVIFYYQFTKREAVIPEIVQPIVQASPESSYDKALMTPAPGRLLDEVGDATMLVTSAPGWLPASVKYIGSSYVFRMQDQGGNLTMLRRWALRENFGISFTQSGVDISMPSAITARSKPAAIYVNQAVLATMIDELHRLLGARQVILGDTTTVDGFQQTELTVNIRDASPGMLDLIARVLANMPVVMKNLQFNVANGLMSGNITLTVIGK